MLVLWWLAPPVDSACSATSSRASSWLHPKGATFVSISAELEAKILRYYHVEKWRRMYDVWRIVASAEIPAGGRFVKVVVRRRLAGTDATENRADPEYPVLGGIGTVSAVAPAEAAGVLTPVTENAALTGNCGALGVFGALGTDTPDEPPPHAARNTTASAIAAAKLSRRI
jgi:hypothetical protein